MRRLSVLITVMLLAGCSGSDGGDEADRPNAPGTAMVGGSDQAVPPENNPPGDIPDNIAFVSYTNSAGKYTFKHPEGWTETTETTTVTFTDKLNGVQAMTGTATAAPTTDSAKAQDVPALTSSQAAFETRSVSAASVPAGKGVKTLYRR